MKVMSTPAGTPAPQVASLRILAIGLCTAPLILVAVLALVLPTGWDDEPPIAVLLGLIALVGFSAVSTELVGFQTEPLDASVATSANDAQRLALSRYQTSMFFRFALTEMPILLGLAASFALDYGLWPLIITAAVGLPVMWFEVWPSRRNANKFASKLETGGIRSWLPEALGHA